MKSITLEVLENRRIFSLSSTIGGRTRVVSLTGTTTDWGL